MLDHDEITLVSLALYFLCYIRIIHIKLHFFHSKCNFALWTEKTFGSFRALFWTLIVLKEPLLPPTNITFHQMLQLASFTVHWHINSAISLLADALLISLKQQGVQTSFAIKVLKTSIDYKRWVKIDYCECFEFSRQNSQINAAHFFCLFCAKKEIFLLFDFEFSRQDSKIIVSVKIFWIFAISFLSNFI